MTEKEKFEAWWADQEVQGKKILNFKPMFNLEGLAKHFGGVVEWVYDDPAVYGIPYERINWEGSTSTPEERIEYMYKIMNEFIAAMEHAKPFKFNDSHLMDADFEDIQPEA
jgi:hypothetical protein